MHFAGLCFPRLPCDRLPRKRYGEARRHAQRRKSRCALRHCASQQGARMGKETLRKIERTHPAPHVRSGYPGSHRTKNCSPRNSERHSQKRIGQMLRGRYFPQKKIVGKTEEGKETHAPNRNGGSSARSLYGCVEDKLEDYCTSNTCSTSSGISLRKRFSMPIFSVVAAEGHPLHEP